MHPAKVGAVIPLVLCVDDDPAVLALLEHTLQSQGCAVITANDGESALEQFNNYTVSAVVLDCEMPGMNGTQVAQRMNRLHPRVPKILFSASTSLPESAPYVFDAVCLKWEGPRALVFQLKSLLKNCAPEADASLQTHIAIASVSPDWGAA